MVERRSGRKTTVRLNTIERETPPAFEDSRKKSNKIDKKEIQAIFEKALQNFAEGQIDEIPVYSQLADENGCSTSLIAQAVWAGENNLKERLQAARETSKKKEKERTIFRKNSNTAWFLGAMFSSGSLKVSEKASGLILTNRDSDVLEAFKLRGENIIGKGGLRRDLADRKNSSIIFNHVGYAQLLAPFSIESRTRQILQKDYAWVREPKFLKSFVMGLFDAGGQVYFSSEPGGNKRVSFATNNNEALAGYYVSTLKKIGIERPRIEREKGKPKRVFFGNIPDLIRFAKQIRSVSQAKQDVLNAILAYEPTEVELRLRGSRAKPKQIFP